MAASGGYFLLAIGDKVYVDNTSLVGSIGVIGAWMGFRRVLDKHDIERRKFTTNENLLESRFDMFDHLKDKDKEWMRTLLKDTHTKFIKHVENHRDKKIKVAPEEREAKIYQADIWLGKRVVELGLADHLGSYEAVLYKEFPTARIVNVTTKSRMERLRETFRSVVKITTSRALPWIILYFCVKGTIKLYLLILVLNRGGKKDEKVMAIEKATHTDTPRFAESSK